MATRDKGVEYDGIMCSNLLLSNKLMFALLYMVCICYIAKYILHLKHIYVAMHFRHSPPCWRRPRIDRNGHELSPAHRQPLIEPWMVSLSMRTMTWPDPACWQHHRSAQRRPAVLGSKFSHSRQRRLRHLWSGCCCWTSRLCMGVRLSGQWMAVNGGEIVVEIWFCYVYRKTLRLRYAMWKFANFHLNAFGFAIIGLILREGKVLHYIYAYLDWHWRWYWCCDCLKFA